MNYAYNFLPKSFTNWHQIHLKTSFIETQLLCYVLSWELINYNLFEDSLTV